jgi:hypothetical protein
LYNEDDEQDAINSNDKWTRVFTRTAFNRAAIPVFDLGPDLIFD